MLVNRYLVVRMCLQAVVTVRALEVLATGNQLKAARALIAMEQVDLADRANVNVNTIRSMEKSGSDGIAGRAASVRAVQKALEAAGVEFLNHGQPGVRLRRAGPRQLVVALWQQPSELLQVSEWPVVFARDDSTLWRPPECQMRSLIVVGCSGLVASCASSASDIKASYISPVAYQGYTCSQLSEEAQRVSSAAAQASGEQDSKRTSDTIATTAAVVVFWPALFLMKGDGANAAELGRLKGQMDAVEQVSIQKKCGIHFHRA